MAKTSLIICAAALLIQLVRCQSIGLAAPCGYSGCGCSAPSTPVYSSFAVPSSGCGYSTPYTSNYINYAVPSSGYGCSSSSTPIYNSFAASAPSYSGDSTGVVSTGGGFSVTSSSSLPPVGLFIVSENTYQGTLTADGNLPFLGSVTVEGALPSGGAGAVSYGCGDGGAANIGSEGPIVTGIVIPGFVCPPSTTDPVATADALALASRGVGYTGLSMPSYSTVSPSFGYIPSGCSC